MNNITLDAYAKINLGIDVEKKRDDGYHDVNMVMQTIHLCDVINIEKASGGQIEVTCSDPDVPDGEENLAYKAAREFASEFNSEFSEEFQDWDFGVKIHIEKNIPSRAGLGGGSADAAAVIRGMNLLFETEMSSATLIKIAERVGSDVPYLVIGNTAHVQGRGEKVTRMIHFPKAYLCIAKPELDISTPKAYAKLDEADHIIHPDIDGLIASIKAGDDIKKISEYMGNSFEEVAISSHPEIGRIKMLMEEKGAIKAMMSGSGPAVFGIFEDEDTALKAGGIVKEAFPGVYVKVTSTV